MPGTRRKPRVELPSTAELSRQNKRNSANSPWRKTPISKRSAKCQEHFAALAKEFSEDIGSQQEGGDLGWVTAGQMVPEFQQVMDQTGNGELSAPFESSFGWHVLQVEDRRTQDLSEEMRRNQARNILFGQKYEDELAIWLQKIRDEAFVEIKI